MLCKDCDALAQYIVHGMSVCALHKEAQEPLFSFAFDTPVVIRSGGQVQISYISVLGTAARLVAFGTKQDSRIMGVAFTGHLIPEDDR